MLSSPDLWLLLGSTSITAALFLQLLVDLCTASIALALTRPIRIAVFMLAPGTQLSFRSEAVA